MKRTIAPITNYARGTIVVALRPLDREGADVRVGQYGVVFEEADFYKDGAGPMVAWTPWDHRPRGSMCNVYTGDVEVLE